MKACRTTSRPLASWVEAVTTALSPLVFRIEAHVRGADRLYLDDTPVPILGKGMTGTGRLWTVVRDDRPFGGPEPPAAAYFYSPDHSGAHAETWLGDFHGIVQADAFSGFGRLYEPGRKPGPIGEAACWTHARRKFFGLADLRKAPTASEVATLIDEIFTIERAANGLAPDERCAHQSIRSAALVTDLEAWLRENRAKLSAKAPTAAAIDYLLKRWTAFTRFLDDGRICLSNIAAERSIRPIAVGRRNWTFAGSDTGGHRAAALYTLIETAKLNRIDPQARLADVLARLPDHPARRIDDLAAAELDLVSAPSDRRLTPRWDHKRGLHRRRTVGRGRLHA
ncbi:IS66 family transposase [Methylobacterium sp. WL69]|uniref:IS66 family transposase n=1 Tax=Methylobacterium sp. WL69 TaxID=2603893 RepID=UPI0011C88318|nr:IS66 family transposase [Methylobacterium sp. WL69]TXM71527.1 IS66 family transposase [Methylobacterium sp. WL69]